MGVSASYTPKVHKANGGDVINMKSGAVASVDSGVGGFANQIRVRTTLANVNAGATLLAALPGFAYRIHDIAMIAIGGNATAATTVDVLGTQSTSSVKLFAGAIANLTRSAVLRAGATGGTVLADGASFAACDANTAITIGVTGSALTTSTHIDVLLTYSVEAQ